MRQIVEILAHLTIRTRIFPDVCSEEQFALPRRMFLKPVVGFSLRFAPLAARAGNVGPVGEQKEETYNDKPETN
jgi:hypothetical protein